MGGAAALRRPRPRETVMQINVGWVDRIVRFALAVVAFWLFFTGARPAWEWVALIVGVIFALTALAGYCPLYTVFGIRTNRNA